jgi:hypothetical protein
MIPTIAIAVAATPLTTAPTMIPVFELPPLLPEEEGVGRDEDEDLDGDEDEVFATETGEELWLVLEASSDTPGLISGLSR